MAFTLHVRVVEANDIPKMDLITDTDAYCILRTGSETRKTYTCQNCKHPRWNQEFHFNVSSPTVGSLGITMRDEDVFKDDNISYIDIPYCSLPTGQVIDQWYHMTPFRRVKKGGRLHLVLHMSPAGLPPFVPSNAMMHQTGFMAPVYQSQSVYMIPPCTPQPAYCATVPCIPQQPGYYAPAYPPQTGIISPGQPYPQPGFVQPNPAYYQGYPPRY